VEGDHHGRALPKLPPDQPLHLRPSSLRWSAARRPRQSPPSPRRPRQIETAKSTMAAWIELAYPPRQPLEGGGAGAAAAYPGRRRIRGWRKHSSLFCPKSSRPRPLRRPTTRCTASHDLVDARRRPHPRAPHGTMHCLPRRSSSPRSSAPDELHLHLKLLLKARGAEAVARARSRIGGAEHTRRSHRSSTVGGDSIAPTRAAAGRALQKHEELAFLESQAPVSISTPKGRARSRAKAANTEPAPHELKAGVSHPRKGTLGVE
jgi:hypothetical protein